MAYSLSSIDKYACYEYSGAVYLLLFSPVFSMACKSWMSFFVASSFRSEATRSSMICLLSMKKESCGELSKERRDSRFLLSGVFKILIDGHDLLFCKV